MKDYMYDVFFDADGNPRKYHTCEDVYIDGDREECEDFKTDIDGALTFRIRAYNPNVIKPMKRYKIRMLGFDGDFAIECEGIANQFGEVITNVSL